MSYATERVILFDRNMIPLDEIAPDEIFSRVRTEEINGEHSLVLVTTRRLQEGWRALTVDDTGKWREWVVTEIDEEHSSGKTALGTYHLVWSLQYDLTMTYTHTHTEIGYGEAPKAAGAVAMLVCQRTSWTAGTCTAPNVPDGTGAVFIYESAWSKLSKAVECMGCEVDATILVTAVADPDYDLTTPFYIERYLNLMEHVGSKTALRRFDWSEDLTSIKRTPDPGPYYCRVAPLGKRKNGKEYAYDRKTEFDWPLDITEETSVEEGVPGPYYIEDAESALVFRRMNSAGTWVYPTVAVNYDEDDPELLLKVAQEDLHNHTRPGVTYEANVLQLAQAGMDVQGVALGDEVQIVDYGFNPDVPLRVQGRVIKIEVDELSPETTTELTIGQLRDNFTNTVSKLASTLDKSITYLSNSLYSTNKTVEDLGTAEYVQNFIDRLNAQINAGGGYTYIVPGEGLIVYNVAVSDPLVGREASSVVQIKNGSIRIANSRKDQFSGIDDWNWKSVFDSGHIATEVLLADNIITGKIQDAKHKVDSTTGNYWDLDNSMLVMKEGSIIANLITAGKIQSVSRQVYFDLDNNEIAANRLVSTNSQNDKTVVELSAGRQYASYNSPMYSYLKIYRTDATGEGSYILIKPPLNTSGYNKDGIISVPNPAQRLILAAGDQNTSTYNPIAQVMLSETNSTGYVDIIADSKTNTTGIPNGYVYIEGKYIRIQTSSSSGASVNIGSSNSTVTINGTINAYGGKNRVVETESYGKRVLSCYETPTPMFGDMGSASLDESGEAIVSIDAVFAETVQCGIGYKVFLQKCGQGDLWVSKKNADYFVVEGTPNLSFDWEIKAVQSDFVNQRLEDWNTYVPSEVTAESIAEQTESVYNDPIAELEQMYDEERAA